MRGEQSRLQITTHGHEEEVEEEEEEEEAGRTTRNGKPEHSTDIMEATRAQRMSPTPSVKVSSVTQQQSDKLICSSWKSKSFLCSDTRPLPPAARSVSNGTSSPQGPSCLPQNELSLSPSLAVQSSSQDSFNSSFSFIQQSLNSSQRTETTTVRPPQEPEPLNQSTNGPNLPQTKPAAMSIEHNFSKRSTPVQSLASSATGSHADGEELSLGGRFWQECLWDGREVTSDLPDCDSLDIEITSSLSVDSDNASASSVTSGYESATPASDQGWDGLLKKYEGVLQDCLLNNRTHTKVGMTGS